MADLTRLPGILRAAGVVVAEWPGWIGRGRDGAFDPRGLMIHHDASAVGQSPGMAKYIAEQGRPEDGIMPPLAQIWVDTTGTWYLLASGRCNHAGRGSGWGVIPADAGNTYSIGIETDHTVGETWQPIQLQALARGSAAICRVYGWDPSNAVTGHKEYAPGRKIDPAGIDMAEFRRRIGDVPGSAGSLPSTGEWDEMATADEIRTIVRQEVEGLLAYPHPGNAQMVAILRGEGISGANSSADRVGEMLQSMLAYPQPANRHLVGILRSEGVSGSTGAIAVVAARISALAAAIQAAGSLGGTADMAAVQAAAAAGAEEGARAALEAAQVTVDINVGETP